MERLTPLSTAFLDAEDADRAASLVIGSLAVFEGPAPPFEDFVRTIEGRLPSIPRYRQRLRTVPLDLGAPVWVDDPGFDVRWHIRHTALPAPGGPEEVGRLMGRVMSRRMDRNRPLWEYWFCEGLADGRWGLISKLHHSVVDGVSGTDLYRLVLDPTPEPGPALPDTWSPRPVPSDLTVTAHALWDLATTPATAARALAATLRSPRRLVGQTGRLTRGLFVMSGALRPVATSSLNGPLDGSVRYAWTGVPLADIATVRHALGGTVNDVALAVVTGAFRRLLISRGERPTAHTLRSLVPVSTRAPGTESVPDNRISMMLPFLPVDVADPRRRLDTIRDRLRTLRESGEVDAGASLTTMAEYEPFPPISLGLRVGFHLPQHQLATVTTNVPGPRATLYGLGRELVEILPYVPIADRVRIGVAMFSYRGMLTFGITADYGSVPDVDVLVGGIDVSMSELLEAARGATSAGSAEGVRR
jgi:WS/DGAT/MGAT family acyltransferase